MARKNQTKKSTHHMLTRSSRKHVKKTLLDQQVTKQKKNVEVVRDCAVKTEHKIVRPFTRSQKSLLSENSVPVGKNCREKGISEETFSNNSKKHVQKDDTNRDSAAKLGPTNNKSCTSIKKVSPVSNSSNPVGKEFDGKSSGTKTKKCDQREDQKSDVTPYQRYAVGDILWAKMRGFPLWPAKIEGIPEEPNMLELRFYGDRTKAKMFKTALIPFDKGAENFIPGSRHLLNKAVKEALFDRKQQEINNEL